ncbi:hypothetical protein E2P81_ATG03880 [Venturia nashicola]|uniref:Uncharacterized protein n=1 Tax=Venturia nashicola TaxID=86259 RepID=A0A4Z1PCI2_9PEZI|nr:hypothetical protein E6O75_ATG03971 [Venturia nashicola]TLD38205.1 hypothetical protein E2P81_ATG03880 [Venturia nashicola]
MHYSARQDVRCQYNQYLVMVNQYLVMAVQYLVMAVQYLVMAVRYQKLVMAPIPTRAGKKKPSNHAFAGEHTPPLAIGNWQFIHKKPIDQSPLAKSLLPLGHHWTSFWLLLTGRIAYFSLYTYDRWIPPHLHAATVAPMSHALIIIRTFPHEGQSLASIQLASIEWAAYLLRLEGLCLSLASGPNRGLPIARPNPPELTAVSMAWLRLLCIPLSQLSEPIYIHPERKPI